MSSIRPNSFAIMGAGLAGLSAGQSLLQAGVQAQIFDRGRGVGGRCSSRRALPFGFDHGAQYFTVRDPGFETVVRTWQNEGTVAPWLGRIVSISDNGQVAESKGTTRFVGVPGMNAVPQALATGLAVHSECNVQGLQRSAFGWTLHGDEGQSLGEFDQVLLAMPPSPTSSPPCACSPPGR